MSQLTEQQKALNEILSSKGFDFIDASEIESWVKDEEDLAENLQERISEQDIIYYPKAMDYLKENDPSLCDCMAIAHDLGYTTDKLNSELLATLLYQQKLSENIDGLVDRLENFAFVRGNEEEKV